MTHLQEDALEAARKAANFGPNYSPGNDEMLVAAITAYIEAAPSKLGEAGDVRKLALSTAREILAPNDADGPVSRAANIIARVLAARSREEAEPVAEDRLNAAMEAHAAAFKFYQNDTTQSPEVNRRRRAEQAMRAALASPPPNDAGMVPTYEQVGQAMQEAWDEICDDTGNHPLDIEHTSRRRLSFTPHHWAELTAMRLRALAHPKEPA